jgi:long-subunit fatty acid transport protein
MELEGPFYLQTGPLAGTPTLLDLQATGAAATGSVGMQYKLRPNTVVGLSYTEQTKFYLDGNARAQIGPLQSAFDARTRLIWPRSLGLGVKQNLSDYSRFGFDVVWYDWSSAFSQLPLTLSDPTNPIVAGLLGPQLSDSFPLRWHDTVSYKFGYEWSPSDLLTCRLGYVYHNSPVSNATLNPYLDGILANVLTAGVSRRVGSSWLNLAYQYSWSPTRNVVDSAIVGDDFDNSTLRADAHWIGVSVLTLY